MNIKNKHLFFSFFTLMFMLASLSITAQENTLIRLEGKVFDRDNEQVISYFMIVNKSTGSGTFGNADGSFVLNASPQDTIIIGAHGYTTSNYILPKDNGENHKIKKSFYLKPVVINLPEVVIIPERELKEIKADIDRLGYEEKDYRISGVNAIEHPITFLYQAFSKRERSYRKVAELENESRRRDLLKELFRKYVDYEIISLKDKDFDAFVDYCNITDYQMKSSTQYDFIKLIKIRYQGWQIYSRRLEASPIYKKIHAE